MGFEGAIMKKVLILGANRATVTLVQKAKEMGLYTIVTDYNPNAYAKRYADQAENVDCMDIDALVALGRRENVDGVLLFDGVPYGAVVSDDGVELLYTLDDAITAQTWTAFFNEALNASK